MSLVINPPVAALATGNTIVHSPCVMGIVNITPDSFSDGGRFVDKDRALRHALKLLNDGATWLDIGAESTRPGATLISAQQELDRLMPLIELLRKETDCYLSVDTSKPEVMREVIAAGIQMINDVNALEAPGALSAVANYPVDICLMHKKGLPDTMQENPEYQDVVAEVCEYLAHRVAACELAGIAPARLCIDPGFGFGKTAKHNLQLINSLEQLMALELPVLIGVSRKATIGEVLKAEVDKRLAGSLSLAVIAYLKGASIFRVHDVKETVDALAMAQAVFASKDLTTYDLDEIEV